MSARANCGRLEMFSFMRPRTARKRVRPVLFSGRANASALAHSMSWRRSMSSRKAAPSRRRAVNVSIEACSGACKASVSTYVPLPRRLTTKPRALSDCMASRTAGRLARWRTQSCCSAGSRSPGRRRPARMARSRSATMTEIVPWDFFTAGGTGTGLSPVFRMDNEKLSDNSAASTR